MGCDDTESIDKFKKAIIIFTSQFPNYTSVHYWEIQNVEIIEKLNILTSNNVKIDCPHENISLNINFDMNILKPKNCITGGLNPDFKSITDFYKFEF